jgi:hypothetical protein
MNDVKKLRAELKSKEARYRAEMNKESDELEDKVLGYAKNAGIIISVLAGGYFIAKSFQGKDSKAKNAVISKEPVESKMLEQNSGFSLPSILTQKLLVGAAQIGLALMTMNVKKRMKSKSNGRDTESAED